MNSQLRNVCGGQMSFFPGRSARILRFWDTRNQWFLQDLDWKNHEIQIEVHSESNSSLNVCPVVDDVMDEENMYDKDEQSRGEQRSEIGTKEDFDANIG